MAQFGERFTFEANPLFLPILQKFLLSQLGLAALFIELSLTLALLLALPTKELLAEDGDAHERLFKLFEVNMRTGVALTRVGPGPLAGLNVVLARGDARQV